MPIYEKPVRLLMPDMISALAPTKEKQFSKDDAVAWFATHYPKIKEGTISAHLIRFSTNAPSRLHYSVRPDEDMLFQIDGSTFRPFNPLTDSPAIHSNIDLPNPPTPAPEDDEPDSPREFAYEKDLKNFLAKNLSLIEPGLRLYQDEEIIGIEFPVGGRFIDILAVDSKNRLVVLELKVSRGYDRVVGQLLRYMAWIQKNQAETGQAVRGVIIAREISEDLQLACSFLQHVALYEYALSVSLKPIALDAAP